jgi:hypothetical protein
MSKFGVEVDPERVEALKNDDPPLYEPTDVVVTDENRQGEGNTNPEMPTADGSDKVRLGTDELGGDEVGKDDTQRNTVEQVDAPHKETPAFAAGESSGYLEVVEEDAEAERLAAIEAARSEKSWPASKNRPKPAKKTTSARLTPKKPAVNKRKRGSKNSNEKEHDVSHPPDESASKKPDESENVNAGLDNDNVTINMGSELLEEYLDMPMGDEEEHAGEGGTRDDMPSAAAAAAASAMSTTGTKTQAPATKPTRKSSGKIAPKKASGAKGMKKKIRPLPGKKKKA